MDVRHEAAGNNGREVPMSSKLKQKIRYILTNTTVEPLVVFYYMPISLTIFAIDNLNLEKACRVNLEYNSTVCDSLSVRNISGLEAEDDIIDKMVSGMKTWKNILHYSIPTLFIIFIGSWSDRTNKRKPLLLLPLLGELLTNIGLLLCTYYFVEWRMEVAGVVEGLFPAITGSDIVFNMALFSYISDITTEENRTYRIGVINMVAFLCSSIGPFIGGHFFRSLTFYGMFSISAISYILGIIYCWFCIKEVEKNIILSSDINKNKNFFDLGLVRETFFILFKRRENYQRLVLCLLFGAFISVVGPAYGEASVFYFFSRDNLVWTEKENGYFSTYSTLITFLGTLFTVSVLSKILKLNDCLIGLLVCISRVLGVFCYAFSSKGWHIYLGQAFDILNGASQIPVRSIVSKIVHSNEIGRAFSLMGVSSGIIVATFGPLYFVAYNAKPPSFGGAFFFLSIFFMLIAGAIFITVYVFMKRGKVHWDEHTVELDAAQNDQKRKEQHVNEAFENEEHEAIDSKL